MKRVYLFIFLLLGFVMANAQESLSEKLLRGAATDKQKVTAIFRWITANINYNSSPQRRINPPITEEEEGPLKPLHERVAEMVIKRKTAFCDGFARLFTALCDKAGLQSIIICGYAPGGFTRQPARLPGPVDLSMPEPVNLSENSIAVIFWQTHLHLFWIIFRTIRAGLYCRVITSRKNSGNHLSGKKHLGNMGSGLIRRVAE